MGLDSKTFASFRSEVLKWTTLSLDDREEVVCRSALQYSKKLTRIDAVQSPLALLLSIAASQRVQLFREKSRRRRAEKEARELAILASIASRCVETTLDEIRQQVDQLPKPERDVMTLRFIQGLKLREAADLLQVSPAVAANLTFRGKRQLRRHFAGQL